MKATELRLENLVIRNGIVIPIYQIEHRRGNIYRINDIDIDFSDSKQVEKLCSPLPITEEWLKKFGFQKLQKAWIVKDVVYYPKKKFVAQHWMPVDIDVYKKYTGWLPCANDIEFVHELQNIFHSLKRTELQLSTKSYIVNLKS